MAGISRLSKLKEAADKKKKGQSNKSDAPAVKKAEVPAPKPAPEALKEAAKPAQIRKPEPAEEAVFPDEEPPPKVNYKPASVLPTQLPPPAPPPPSITSLIMSDDRIDNLSDKLLVVRAVLKRYDEIEKGKKAEVVVEEEIKRFISGNKRK